MTEPDLAPTAPVSPTLAEALDRHSIALPADQIVQLEEYCRRLWEWNEKLNLTRHTDYDKFVSRDMVDSLKLAAELPQDTRVLDVGTGGGVPGVILAIVRPDLDVTLTESIQKKARAVDNIVHGMNLPAIVHHGRAEELLGSEHYDNLVVRAVAPLVKLLRWFQPHWGSIGKLLVIKGPAWVDERHDARSAGLMNGLNLRRLASWPLPGTESESVLLGIWPKEDDDD